MKNNKIPHCQNSSNRKIAKYHTVRPVPTSMKNNKIPHCQNSSNRKTTKYHTLGTVPIEK
jgi:exosome complex RNA-binding protein Csl4